VTLFYAVGCGVQNGFERSMLNGKVEPGSAIAIVVAGPIGLTALLIAEFYSPAQIIIIDIDDNRLPIFSRFGATKVINNTDGKSVEEIMEMTGRRGRYGHRGGGTTACGSGARAAPSLTSSAFVLPSRATAVMPVLP